MSPILQIDKLVKSYGAVKVADELSVSVQPGEALGVIGPNGAGKTSMFNLITGTVIPTSGTIKFSGQDITHHSAAKRCRSGIARSFQVPQPFGGLSVLENVMVAATQAAGLSGKSANSLCIDVLEQTGLAAKANVQAGKLTLLERKRLELSRALCAKPNLLLLDEIAGGLTEDECQSLIATIKDIHKTGVSIIWIEHVVHALLAVVERLAVIDFGRLIATGDPTQIMQSTEVKSIYLGIAVDA
jgi:branched-chain amino acid transport system ATP-binding protein